jgi:CHAT domain-containing protein
MQLFKRILLFPLLWYLQPAVSQPSAAMYLEQAIEAVKNNEEEQAAQLFSQAIDIFEKKDSLEQWIQAHKDYGKAFRSRKQDVAFDKAVQTFLQSQQTKLWRAPSSREEWDALVWLYVNLAYVYNYKLANYDDAIEAYEMASHIHTTQLGPPDRLVIKYIYKPLANIYTRLGDAQAAVVYLEKCVDFYAEQASTEDYIEAKSDLAMALLFTKAITPAEQQLEDALELDGLSTEHRVLLYANMSRVQLDLDKAELAIEYINKAIHLLKGSIEKEETHKKWKWLVSLYTLKGEILISEKQFPEGEKTLRLAEHHLNTRLDGYQKRDLMPVYTNLARLYKQQKDFKKAIEAYHDIFSILLVDFNPDSWRTQPDPAYFSAEYMLIDALAGKAACLHDWFEETGNQEMLQLGLKCHELIFEVEQLQRRAYRYESSKLDNVADARNRSAQAIELALQLWRTTGEEAYKERAFAFAERSKSTLMLEAFYNSRAVSLAGLPDSVLKRESLIQKSIAELEEQLYTARQASAEEDTMQELKVKLLTSKQKYTDWISQLEGQYPNYYKLKYNVNTLSVQAVQQQLLDTEQVFVEYFLGEKMAYVFVISKDKFELIELSLKASLNEMIIRFRKNIEAFQLSTSNRSQLCEEYGQLAYQLYQELVQPVEHTFSMATDLIIVPSGALGLLPFDALVQKQVTDCNFQAFPFLVNQYNISYAYSATLQYALNNREVVNNKLAGFAPEFDGSAGFGQLNHNIALLENIQPLMKSDNFLRGQATQEKIKQAAATYGLFHFATHAQANTSAENFSFIVFSDGRGAYDSLFVKDIYLLPLHAEMVVLSACETAVGKFYEGEGVISLARSFLYAGANSVITTQWSINDTANRKLMESFYGHLKAGKTKSEALREAKREQIEGGGKLGAHPVYWAAFAPIGNMREINTGIKIGPYLIVFLLGLVCVGLFIGYRKGKRLPAI